jgi:hypothetical protein
MINQEERQRFNYRVIIGALIVFASAGWIVAYLLSKEVNRLSIRPVAIESKFMPTPTLPAPQPETRPLYPRGGVVR